VYLALIGTKIQGKIIAKPGHFVNTQFAKKCKIKIEQRNYVPVYDLNLEL
jgi:UDP-3-O-[3-hydroxymyristoyl] N-acetylglucosamine deacetylase/3-hydroxyacyl-[acyl-carrier-protein] dehydratase